MIKSFDDWLKQNMNNVCEIEHVNFEAKYLGEWVQQIDCNDCSYLSLTEEQQEYQGKGIHRCLYYDERVFHRTNNLIHNRMIYPCDKCYKDKHEAFIERQ